MGTHHGDDRLPPLVERDSAGEGSAEGVLHHPSFFLEGLVSICG